MRGFGLDGVRGFGLDGVRGFGLDGVFCQQSSTHSWRWDQTRSPGSPTPRTHDLARFLMSLSPFLYLFTQRQPSGRPEGQPAFPDGGSDRDGAFGFDGLGFDRGGAFGFDGLGFDRGGVLGFDRGGVLGRGAGEKNW